MGKTLTEYFAGKLYSEEKKSTIVYLLKFYWKHSSNEYQTKMIRSELLELLKKRERLELVERLFANEYTKFDRISQWSRLLEDPAWQKINEELKRMDETQECPFCFNKMKQFPSDFKRPDVLKCHTCVKVFLIHD